jgi:catechol 2,3-dioxygenase-like lactoylglutathione lyase family enzyme
MRTEGLHHTSRTVADMDRSLAFYRDLLGMQVILDTEMRGDMLSREVALPDAHLRLAELASGSTQPFLELLQYFSPSGAQYPEDARCSDVGAHHVAVLVDDIRDAFDHLTKSGVRFTCEPQRVDVGFFAGHWTAYCYDPDGLVVELWQLPPQAPDRSAPTQEAEHESRSD